MSCSWDIICVDCREMAGIDNANHEDELMRTLIKHRDAIAALADLAGDSWSFDLVINSHYVSPSFFAKHFGHVLRPFSEYRTFDAPCDQDFVCPVCRDWVKCSQQEHWLSRNNEHYHHFEKGVHMEKGRP